MIAEQTNAQHAVKTAKHALEAAKNALVRAREERERLERVACLDCSMLRTLGGEACEDIEHITCLLCDDEFCTTCFDAMGMCDRCAERSWCIQCCRERHGEDGDKPGADSEDEDEDES